MLNFDIPRGITAIVGGGGKTSLLMYLAKKLACNNRVIVTTTTRMWPPDCEILYDPLVTDIADALKRHNLVAVGMRAERGKMKGLERYFDVLPQLADYVIVEADGSKGLPLKAPDDHEPPIPQNTALVLAVAGLDGIGKKICDVAHRPEIYARIVGASVDDVVKCDDVARVLMSRRGQRKNVSGRFAVVLNKADTPERIFYAYDIAPMLNCDVYITALSSEKIIDVRRCVQ